MIRTLLRATYHRRPVSLHRTGAGFEAYFGDANLLGDLLNLPILDRPLPGGDVAPTVSILPPDLPGHLRTLRARSVAVIVDGAPA